MTATPAKPRRSARTGMLVAVAALTGLTIGSCLASGDDTTTQAPAAPAPTVTRNVEVPGPTRTVTPDACLAALTSADAGFGYAGEGFDAASRGFHAMSDLDVDAMTTALNDIESLQVEMEPTLRSYAQQRDECRAAGGDA